MLYLKQYGILTWFLFALLMASATRAFAWGPQGHRVAGALTWAYLSSDAQRAVTTILGDQTLADASLWADRMRGNPSPFWQETAGAYHYVTVAPDKQYRDIGAPAQGDGVTALAQFAGTLSDPGAAMVEKQLALRFGLHIVQDLHQPLHVGNGQDRGGTRYTVNLRGESTNLHRIWDSSILEAGQRSDRGWIRRLHMSATEAADYWQADPLIWIAESAALRDRIYPKRTQLDEEYLMTWLPEVEQRLALAAVRGAAWIEFVLLPDD